MKFIWFALLLIMVGKLIFSSIVSYLIFGNELTIYLNDYREYSNLVFYITHFISFILAAILAYVKLSFFKKRNINLPVTILIFLLLSLPSFISYFIAFGQLFLIILFMTFLIYVGIDLFSIGQKKSGNAV